MPLVLGDPRRVGLVAAELVVNRLAARPGSRLLLPAGRASEGMYAALRAHAAEGALAAAAPTVLQLDEYASLAPGDPRSVAARLRRSSKGSRSPPCTRSTGALRTSTPRRRAIRRELDRAPIDLAVLLLGRDGHVAFDEPPGRFASGVSLVRLAEHHPA